MYKSVFLLIISFVINSSLFAQEIDRIEGSIFSYSKKPDTIFVVYDDNFNEEEILIIQTLQGIISKEKPAIYRDVGTGSSIWINDLISKDLVFIHFLFH